MAITEQQRQLYNQRKREKYASDPEEAKKRSNEWARKKYASDSEFREEKLRYQSRRYYNDPEFRENKKAYSRKNYRRHDLRNRYGVSPDEYAEMLEAQDGVCAVCKETDGKTLGVDHCHESGLVRGLLCGNCNRALGMLKDDPKRITALAEYLAQYQAEGVI